MLRPKQAAEYIGLSHSHFWAEVNRGAIPRPFNISPRATALPKPWLDHIIAERANAASGEPKL